MVLKKKSPPEAEIIAPRTAAKWQISPATRAFRPKTVPAISRMELFSPPGSPGFFQNHRSVFCSFQNLHGVLSSGFKRPGKFQDHLHQFVSNNPHIAPPDRIVDMNGVKPVRLMAEENTRHNMLIKIDFRRRLFKGALPEPGPLFL